MDVLSKPMCSLDFLGGKLFGSKKKASKAAYYEPILEGVGTVPSHPIL